MKSAFIFPGQGEENSGMAVYIKKQGPIQRLLEKASDQLKLDLPKIISQGSSELTSTAVLQPTLVALSVGLALELLHSKETPDAVAGHSLGELSAAAIAGCISPELAVDIAVKRGALMNEAAKRSPGVMAALTTLDIAEVEAALSLGNSVGRLDLAAQNTPSQWVLSGDKQALNTVAERYTVTKMPVAGAWHSRLMQEAEHAWLQELRAITWKPPQLPWFCNRDGSQVKESDDIPALLAGQLTRPVRWSALMKTLSESGIERLVMLGPCRSLRGLCRANIEQITIETAQTLLA
jgi:[acyl-carrier-protein] S-malonyltransferase